jgi:xanthine dehydrogenase small subunit
MTGAGQPQAGVTVNGRTRPLDGVRVHTSALDFLRDLGLTGVKEGCAEGHCGACSVLVNRPAGQGSQWTAVNACLIQAAALDGQEVVTAEGLGSPGDLHPCQQRMADLGGSQCGYCTPGFVCSMAAEYYRADRAPGEASHEHGSNGFDLHALSGNLCRCTGYRPIKDAAFGLGTPEGGDPLSDRLAQPAPDPAPTLLDSEAGTFARPATLEEALALLARHEDAVPVAGSTDLGVEVNLRGLRPPLLVPIDRLPALREVTVADDAITLGASLTLSEIEGAIGGQVPLLDEVWPQFASRLIRNGATLGGNLGTASPIGDTPPALLALEAELVLAGPDGERTVPLADYFTGYRESVREKSELIKAVRIPLPVSGLTAFHKIAKRRFDDISSVAVGLALDVVDGEVRKARIGLGGVAATPIRALDTEAAPEGRPWIAETVEAAAQVLAAEGSPIDDQRASAAYRSAMLGNSLRRLWSRYTDPSGRHSTQASVR